MKRVGRLFNGVVSLCHGLLTAGLTNSSMGFVQAAGLSPAHPDWMDEWSLTGNFEEGFPISSEPPCTIGASG